MRQLGVDPSDNLAAVLSAHPDIEDCVVLPGTDPSDPRAVGYVVARKDLDLDRLEVEMREKAPAHLRFGLVQVSSIPLTADGRTDEERLRREPIIDADLLRRWQEALAGLPGIGGVVVSAGSVGGPEQRWHAADVVPGWSYRGRAKRAEAAGLPQGQVREAAVRFSSDPASDSADANLSAVSDGGTLVYEEGTPGTLDESLRRAAAESPSRGLRFIAADLSSSAQSYPQLLDDAEYLVPGLRQLGLVPGDRAILQFTDNAHFLTAFWACVLSGVIPVPAATAPTYAESNAATRRLAAAWEMLGRPTVLTSADLLSSLRSIARHEVLDGFRVESIESLRATTPCRRGHQSQPHDVALIMLTSGSTGQPKGVKLTHANLIARSIGSTQMNRFSRDEVTFNWMPLDHVAGILFFHLRDVFLGCEQIHCPIDLVLGDPLLWWDLVDRYRCTITFAPNFAFGLVNDRAAALGSKAWDLSCMRVVLNGAEPIVASTARRFMKMLMPYGLPATAMWPAWGMSEISSGVTYSHRFSLDSVKDEDSFVEVGRPIPGVVLRIVDDAGRTLPEGVAGNLQVNGATLMAGYYDGSLDADAFSADGWFRTGDLAAIREGHLTITGRDKDVIIVNGANFYPHEIEQVVESVDGVEVSYTAAFPVRMPGSDTDQLAVAFSSACRVERDLVNLLRTVRTRIIQKTGISPSYLLPVTRDAIPKTSLGKIQRPQLAVQFSAGGFDEVLARVDRLLGRNTVPDWFYARRWRRKSLGDVRSSTRVPLLVLGDGETGAALFELLAGNDCVRVVAQTADDFVALSANTYGMDPTRADHFERLFEMLLECGRYPRTVVLEVSPRTHDRWDAADPDVLHRTVRLSSTLIALTQALAARKPAAPIDLVLVSRRAMRVADTDGADPEVYAAQAILKSIPHELSHVTVRHVDLEGESPTALLETELRATDVEREVAYRAGARWVSRLQKIEFRSRPRPQELFREGGTYVVSGGLGGIGRLISRHLVEEFGARLVLVGRRPLDSGVATAQPADQERIAALADLQRAGGRVRYAAVDVADAGALKVAVQQALDDWGGEIDGVIHLAGSYDPKTLLEESPDSLVASLRAKVAGGLALYSLVSQRSGSLFLSSSSVNGFFGGYAAGAYAAGSAFMHGFSEYLASRTGLVSRCIAWSMWDDVGMSRDFAAKEAAQRRGYRLIKPREGVYSLLTVTGVDEPYVVIGIEARNPNLRSMVESDDLGLQLPVAYVTVGDPGTSVPDVSRFAIRDRFGTPTRCRIEPADRLPAGFGEARDGAATARDGITSVDGRKARSRAPSSTVEKLVTSIWQEELGLDVVGVDENFFDVGGSSVLLARVAARLGEALAQRVPTALVYEYPTISALAARLDPVGCGPTDDLSTSDARGRARRQRRRRDAGTRSAETTGEGP